MQVKNFIPRESPKDIAKRLLRTQYVSDAEALIQAVVGQVSKSSTPGRFFSQEVLVLRLGERRFRFKTNYEMTQWLIKEIVPVLIAQAEA